MEAHIFLKDGDAEKLLAKVTNLEVVPRGTYIIDGEVYQYTGQPIFIIEKDNNAREDTYRLDRVEIVVEKPLR